MSEISAEKIGRKFQVGIRTVVFLVATIAVWMGFYINREENRRLESRIKAMEPLARELVIDDPTQIAVVKMEELWYGENRWEVYLPGEARLRLATRGIEEEGVAKAVPSATVASGRHQVAWEQVRVQDGWRVTVTWDGKTLLSAEEPKEWDPNQGSIGGASYSLSTQLPTDQPAILVRCRFMKENAQGEFTAPDGPANGILIWMEKTGKSQP